MGSDVRDSKYSYQDSSGKIVSNQSGIDRGDETGYVSGK